MITIPDTVWSLMLEQFKRARKGVERVAYLDGLPLQGGGGVVTTLVFPDATLAPGWYEVSPDAMSRAGAHFRAHGLVRLAQVHTHRGRWVAHSERDSEKAYSQETGALSIVVPFHGRCKTRPAGCGVNLRTHHGWQLLDREQAERAIALVPGYLDFRR